MAGAFFILYYFLPMQKQITFFGRVYLDQGRARIEMRDGELVAAQVLEAMGGKPCRLRVVFVEDERERKPWVTKYYWGVVIPKVVSGAKQLGNDWSREDAHEHLKQQYNGGASTSLLTTEAFIEYIERCCQFAAEFLGVYIAPPTFAQTEHLFPNQK